MSVSQLPAINCPGCQRVIDSGVHGTGPIGSAYSYETCLRRCTDCGIGFSNANTSDISKITLIYEDPLDNIPAEVSDGALDTLAHAVNVQNRTSKVRKFAFSTSEDAITWTVFRALQLGGQLGATLNRAGLLPAGSGHPEPSLLLWGVPVPEDDANGRKVASKLAEIAIAVKDDPQSRSEPDVILDFGDSGCVIIEVKHRSKNEIKPKDYAGWKDYLRNTEAFRGNGPQVAESGFYELARNWRIGWDLAAGRNFALVNLGPDGLFDAPPVDRFVNSLPDGYRQCFVRMVWSELIQCIPRPQDWLLAFLNARYVTKKDA